MTSSAEVSIWDRQRVWVSAGAVALIFLGAIEALAVTTVMPVVSAALDGASLYALAFAGTLATSVIGMVASGSWCDARGPRGALYAAVSLFIAGLLISGLAVTMPQFLLGRLVQGFGAGGQTVALYVVVARLYPQHLHGRIFAAFAAAWVIPSMVGPFMAGAVAEFLDWRWAFLGVAVLSIIAFALIAVRLAGVDLGTGEPPEGARVRARLLLAVAVAVAAVVVGLTAEAPPLWGWPTAAVAVVVMAVAVRPLLPTGTLRAARGLPSVVLLRGVIAGAFFAGEAYIPYLLMERFGFTPTWAGIALMLAALAWAGASAVQGRHGEAIGNTRGALISLALILMGLTSVLVTALLTATPWIVLFGWACAGAGMGLLYPRLTVLTLAYSGRADQGFNSAALSISDASGSAVALALAGLVFAAVGGGGPAFVAVFVFASALTVLGAVPGVRLGRAAETMTD